MRERVDRTRLRTFMRALSDAARRPLQVYFVGGATAVLEGWREATIGRGLVERQRLQDYFDVIERELHRYPAIDPASFRRAVEAVTSAER
jgi:hypothetical protein